MKIPATRIFKFVGMFPLPRRGCIASLWITSMPMEQESGTCFQNSFGVSELAYTFCIHVSHRFGGILYSVVRECPIYFFDCMHA